MKTIFLALIQILSVTDLKAEDSYGSWLRYEKLKNVKASQQSRTSPNIQFVGNSPTLQAVKHKVSTGLAFLLCKPMSEVKSNESVLVNRDNLVQDLIFKYGQSEIRVNNTGINLTKEDTGVIKKDFQTILSVIKQERTKLE